MNAPWAESFPIPTEKYHYTKYIFCCVNGRVLLIFNFFDLMGENVYFWTVLLLFVLQQNCNYYVNVVFKVIFQDYWSSIRICM